MTNPPSAIPDARSKSHGESVYEINVRIMEERDNFFAFMSQYTTDVDELANPHIEPEGYDRAWDCLDTFFQVWAKHQCGWDRPGHDYDRETGRVTYPSEYHLEGTREFEEFNRLLPHILLAVIDEALRYPERLDLAIVNPDGTIGRRFRRSILYLMESRDARDYKEWSPESRGKTHGLYDDGFAFSFLEEPFPPIHKVEFD